MATMTVPEAEHVIDLVVTALDRRNDKAGKWWNSYRSCSAFQGYDFYQIDIALKLRIANGFLFLSRQPNFEEQFAKEVQFCEIPILPLSLFVPEELMTKISQWDKDSKTLSKESLEYLDREGDLMDEVSVHERWFLEDNKFLATETSESFAAYCKCIGTNDPIYWQKIYTRLGLEYTSTSPRGNSLASSR